MEKTKVVAEIGCNHQGNLDTALRMVSSAKICGADYAKFQKRDCDSCVPNHIKNSPHPNQSHAYGPTYLEHRKALEFTIDQHKKLKQHCLTLGIQYACSVWDTISAKEVISLNPEYIKIPSAANNNFGMLDILFNQCDCDIHISLGMTTKEEKESLFLFLKPYLERVVVYWTTSEYPVPFERLYLREISNLKKIFPRVGYSGHNLGIAVDIAAITLGSEWIERHFTLDRTWKGTDQAASLEPRGMQTLIRDIRAVEQALQIKNVEMTDIEKQTRNKLRG